MTTNTIKHNNIDEKHLIMFAQTLACQCLSIKQNITIYLAGNLGAGKTTFARGFIQYYGINKVKSPTYSLVESYQTPAKTVHHFDCYRLNDAQELELIGIRDYQTSGVICLFEWAEKAKGVIQAADLIIKLIDIPEYIDKRDIIIQADTATGYCLLSSLKVI